MNIKIIYTDNIYNGFGGIVEYPSLLQRMLNKDIIVKIKPKYKNDLGLLKHELKHIEQYKANILHPLYYYFSKKYRYKSELEAYREQIKENKYTSTSQCNWIITALSSKYNLDISTDDIAYDLDTIIKELTIIKNGA